VWSSRSECPLLAFTRPRDYRCRHAFTHVVNRATGPFDQRGCEVGKLKWGTSILAGLFTLGGCYHQVVQTGLPAGTQTVAKPWTPTWIFGLVPATPIDVRATCRSGVAVVDTQMTFMNGLVSGLTLGIFTPRSVLVTCAAQSSANSGAHIEVASAEDSALGAALVRAEVMSRASGRPVSVVFHAVSGTESEPAIGGARP